jgi:outer membrane protein assembly factor BamD
MRYFSLIIITLSLVLGACSNKYQKTLKSTDNRAKLEMADYYFKKKDFIRAISLYEQIEDAFYGTPTAEHILFNNAACSFGLKQYAVAGFQYKTYFENNATNEKAEEALYMNAYCAFLESQEPELDQTDTYKAIETFKIFINIFPESKYVPECNTFLDQLRSKLSHKAYRNAKLYFDMGEYKSSIVALENLVKEFPEIPQKEEVDYLIIKSHYLLAVNSIPEKQKERFENAMKAFESFKEQYTEGNKYMSDAFELNEKSKSAIKRLNKSTILN